MATYKNLYRRRFRGYRNITIGGPCYGRSSGSTGWWEIGKGDAWGGATCWNGYIDEVRMAKVARSDDWIKLSWQLKNPLRRSLRSAPKMLIRLCIASGTAAVRTANGATAAKLVG